MKLVHQHTPTQLPADSKTAMYLKYLHQPILAPIALTRNFTGGVMFLFTAAGYIFGKTEDWSLGAKLGTVLPGMIIGFFASKPVFNYLHSTNTQMAKELLLSQSRSLEINNEPINDHAFHVKTKSALTLASATVLGLATAKLTDSASYGAALTIATAMIGSLISIKKTRRIGQYSLYATFAAMTASIIADLGRIGFKSTHNVFNSGDIPSSLQALNTTMMICTQLVFTIALTQSIKQKVDQSQAASQRKKIHSLKQQELRLLFEAYNTCANAEPQLTYPTTDAAIAELRQHILEDTNPAAPAYSIAKPYHLTFTAQAIHSIIIIGSMFFFYNSGKNIGRDLLGLPNERTIVTYGVTASVAMTAMVLYLSTELIKQYITTKRMPRTTATITQEHAPAQTQTLDDMPCNTVMHAVKNAVISAAPPIFFTIAALGDDAFNGNSAIVSVLLLGCLSYSQLLGKTAPTVLRHQQATKMHSPKDIYIRGLIHMLQAQPGDQTKEITGGSELELINNLRRAIGFTDVTEMGSAKAPSLKDDDDAKAAKPTWP